MEVGGRSRKDRGRGAGKIEGGHYRIQSGGSVWAPEGVTSSFHPLPSKPLPSQPRISPSPSVHSQPPQEPTQPETLDPVGPATVPAPVAATPATGDDILVDMQPLRIQLGGTKRVYQCQVEGCKEGPSTSCTAICSHIRRVHLGMGLVCPLCHKSFFNPDTFRHHKKTLILVNNEGGSLLFFFNCI